MRPRSPRLVAACAAVVVVAATACSGGSATSPTPQQLARLLLESTDLGPEWIETSSGPFDARTDEHPSIEPALWCPEAATDAEVLRSMAGERGADAELEIARPDALFIGVRQQFWSNDAVDDYATTVDGAVTRCDGVEWTDGDGVSYRLDRLGWPGVGDVSVHWSVTTVDPTSSGEAVWRITLSTVRFDDSLMVLQQADARSSDDPVPDDAVDRQELLSIAVARVAAMAD